MTSFQYPASAGLPSTDALERARVALSFLSPNCPRQKWVYIGMGVHDEFGEDGWPIFDAWSAGGDSYKASTAREVWKSFHQGGGKGFGYVVDLAKREGFDAKVKGFVKPTPEQVAEREAKHAARQKLHEAEEKVEAAEAAVRANKRWGEGKDATDDYPYLKLKGIKSHGLKIGVWWKKDHITGEKVKLQNVLYVPITSQDKTIHSLQGITAEGVKIMFSGGKKQGHFFRFGDKPKLVDGKQVYHFAEGFATAASAFEVTGHVTLCCFDAGNLAEVARAVRAKLPQATLVFLADNDAKKEAEGKGNTGMRKAYDAAIELGGLVAHVQGGGDFNDLRLSEGDEAVKKAIEAAAAPTGPYVDKKPAVVVPMAPHRPVVPAGAVASVRDEDRRKLQQVENQQLQHVALGHSVPADISLKDMVEKCIWVAEGEAVAYIGGPSTMFLSFKEFCSVTARSKTKVEIKSDGGKSHQKEAVLNAALWKSSVDRVHVMARTFHAGAGPVCADPEGKTAVNTWRPIARWPARANIQPFLDHVRYLFGDEAEVFLDWAAHIEQRPGELPHYGWLHVARQHGCGRNWLASVFARVFRGYVAPNVDLGALLDSSFNGELGGRVLAVVDEVRAGGGEKAHAYENKLRSMVNPEYRQMNPKFGRQYKEHNACRWLVFSNHLNALPLNDEDRRWRAVVHKAPARAPRVYEELYGLLADPEFINAVAVFLASRDISNFKPGEKPPMTAAKQEVVASAKSMTQGRVDELRKHWPSALITHDDIAQYVTAGASTIFTPAMRHALEDVGAKQIDRQIKIDQRPQRVWALRDVEGWVELKGNDAIRREVEKVRGRGSLINAQAIMEEASHFEEATAL